jgi:hypothetical protein
MVAAFEITLYCLKKAYCLNVVVRNFDGNLSASKILFIKDFSVFATEDQAYDIYSKFVAFIAKPAPGPGNV